MTFVSQAALDAGLEDEVRVEKRLVAVRGTRTVRKEDLLFNGSCPEIEIDAESYTVKADGEVLECEPVDEVPLGQRYFLF